MIGHNNPPPCRKEFLAVAEVLAHARGPHMGHSVRGPGTRGEFIFTRATSRREAKAHVADLIGAE